MSDSVRPHRRQPTRIRSWDSPGKNTGMGCHFLLQCMKVKSESEVAQSCPTLSDPMDCSLPGSPVHGIFQTSTGVGCHCLLRIFLIQGLNPCLLHLLHHQADSLPLYHWEKPGSNNGTPLQYSCLENPMDGGAWWAAFHGVEKSQT